MEIKKGDKGLPVAKIQSQLKKLGFYKLDIDSDFGNGTHDAVASYQKSKVDGVVNEYWYDKIMGEKNNEVPKNDIEIKSYPLTKGEFFEEITPKKQICIHLTAGWANPYLTVRGWENDGGRVQLPMATPYVIGGVYYSNPKAHRDLWKDGEIVQCFDDRKWAYHIGLGSEAIEKRCIGIEVCNFASLEKTNEGNFKAYNGAEFEKNDVEELNFRGIKFWQKITNAQLESLRKLLLYLGEKHQINLKRKYDNTWSDYNLGVINGSIEGVVTHTNFIHPNQYLRWDTPPFPKLLEMLNSL